MKPMRVIAVTALLACLSRAAAAVSMEPPPCINAAANTIELNRCLAEVLVLRDRQLEAAAARVLEKLRRLDADEPMFQRARAFTAAQSRWQAYRAAECEGRSLQWGAGTGAPAASLSCMIELADQRIEALDDAWGAATAPEPQRR